MKKKLFAVVMASMMAVSAFAACSNNGGTELTADTAAQPDTTNASGESIYSEDAIQHFTMFAAMAGTEKNDGNEIMQLIAEKTGVSLKETWLTGQQAGEAIGSIIASGSLPDLIDGGDGSVTLYENDLLVAWDPYLEMYPNLKEMYSDEEWDKFRMDDGHIYWANVFGNHYNNVDTSTGHNGEAFWIQARVLEWAGYPKIETLDEYFQVLEDYYNEFKTMPDGETTLIPYTCLCEGWKYYCLENAPMFLDGYPNDGCCIVNVDDPANPKVVDYNTTDTTKAYFKKLNEEWNKGYMIDPDFAIQTYDEYIAKLSTGRVLGLCDQFWDFAYSIANPFAQPLESLNGQRLDELGCDYVPLGLTINKGMEQQWHSYGDELNQSSGVAVTTSCADPNAAFKFLSDLLEQDVHNLRFWGIEGVDYEVGDDGLFYRTEEQRQLWKDDNYIADHCCQYSYCPQWLGMSRDGKNAMMPSEQTSEFYAGLAEPLEKCFEAYNAKTYADMVGSVYCDQYPWYPLWSWSNNLSSDTDGGIAWQKMGEVKHEWLPKVVMSKNFDSDWDAYQKAYAECKPEDFLAEAQAEVDARLETARANGYTG
ncbi:MAG: sugar ABC transporter substrate-binding protein [Clostridiales bacterium]|nr:sugar ABC transporter substrate-binding protein [Clostridiales bacterium]